jgi:hypothetical protein
MQTAFLPYLLQASGCLAVLYLLYRLLLHRETFFAFNRWYLLGSVVLAALLPRVELPAPVMPLYIMPAIPLDAVSSCRNRGRRTVRLDGAAGKRVRRGRRPVCGAAPVPPLPPAEAGPATARRTPPGYRLLYTGGRLPTFSFFGWLFWDETEALSEAQKDQVLRHEEAHIRQRHSADVLLLEIAGIFLWFNPFVYLLRREIRAVHEYLADREALRTGDRQAYLQLVAGQALQALRIPLIQPFHAPGFRHRIRMIRRAGAHRPALWRATVCLLAVGMLSVLYACRTGELIDPLASIPLGRAERMPEASPEFTKYLARNTRYPLAARRDGVTGTVMARFVVRKDGSITDVEITEGLRKDLDDEVRKHLLENPGGWKPGVQRGKPVDVRCNFPSGFTWITVGHFPSGTAASWW